jgi:hypothetical protein
MSYEEILGWFNYFKRRPVGWREDNRTAISIQATGAEIVPEQAFSSLASLKKYSESDKKLKLKGSVMFVNMLSAKGGDSPAILKEL